MPNDVLHQRGDSKEARCIAFTGPGHLEASIVSWPGERETAALQNRTEHQRIIGRPPRGFDVGHSRVASRRSRLRHLRVHDLAVVPPPLPRATPPAVAPDAPI